MKYEAIKDKLDAELAKRGLFLVWSPRPDPRQPELLVVIGAEQSPDAQGEQLIAGFGSGNTPREVVDRYHEGFLEALESVGIQRSSLVSTGSRVCRGKIWPTFYARLTQSTYAKL